MSFADRVQVVNEEESPILVAARRIAALPVGGPLTPDEIEAVARAEVAPAAFASGFRLWEVQARTALLVETKDGAYIPAKVGGGKALASFLAVKVAWRKGARRVVLHVPARVYVQTMLRKIPEAWRALDMADVPVHGLGGLTRERRMKLARSGWRGLYVLPYSLLSTDDADEILASIDADAVVADEAHALVLRNGAARSRRWNAFMARRRRMFVALSGTMDFRSVADSHHLMIYALGDEAPLPRDRSVLKRWVDVLDADRAQQPDEEKIRGLLPILDMVRHAVASGRVSAEVVGGPLTPDAQGLRRAYRVRRDTAPGVVASSGAEDVATSLLYRNLPAAIRPFTDRDACDYELRFPRVDEDSDAPGQAIVPVQAFHGMTPEEKVHAYIWAVDRRSRTPAGDVVEFAFHGFKWKQELSAGFYNELVWPSAEDVARKRAVDLATAEDLLKRSRRQYERWQRYAAKLRRFLDGDHVPGLDTPELVGNEIKHHGARRLPDDLVKAWRTAKDLLFDGIVERVSRQERVCDYKIQHAIRWAREQVPEGKGAIVWVYNVELGQWAYEEFVKAFGSDRVLHCDDGARADRDFADEGRVKETRTKFCITSLPAHSEGKDLEYFQHMLFLQCPRSAKMLQQAVARLHRPKQEADELCVDFCLTTAFDHQLYNAMLRDAVYAHVVDQPQKVVYADYESSEANPFPKAFPPSFLEERGFIVRKLGKQEEKMLSDLTVSAEGAP